MASETHDVFCPSCNILIAAREISRGSGGARVDGSVITVEDIDTEYHGDSYVVALCPRCDQPFLIRESRYGVSGEFETITDTALLYPSAVKQRPDNMPTDVASSFDQAQRCFTASLYEPCAMMARKCVEGVASVLGVSGGNLKARIEALERAGHINSQLSQWAHEVRLLGNDAAHDVNSYISKNDARDVLEFTEALLFYVFTMSARFKAFKARRQSASA